MKRKYIFCQVKPSRLLLEEGHLLHTCCGWWVTNKEELRFEVVYDLSCFSQRRRSEAIELLFYSQVLGILGVGI